MGPEVLDLRWFLCSFGFLPVPKLQLLCGSSPFGLNYFFFFKSQQLLLFVLTRLTRDLGESPGAGVGSKNFLNWRALHDFTFDPPEFILLFFFSFSRSLPGVLASANPSAPLNCVIICVEHYIPLNIEKYRWSGSLSLSISTSGIVLRLLYKPSSVWVLSIFRAQNIK